MAQASMQPSTREAHAPLDCAEHAGDVVVNGGVERGGFAARVHRRVPWVHETRSGRWREGGGRAPSRRVHVGPPAVHGGEAGEGVGDGAAGAQLSQQARPTAAAAGAVGAPAGDADEVRVGEAAELLELAQERAQATGPVRRRRPLGKGRALVDFDDLPRGRRDGLHGSNLRDTEGSRMTLHQRWHKGRGLRRLACPDPSSRP